LGVHDTVPAPVRDLKARLLLSPVFGLAIPALSGLVDSARHSTTGLAASYAYFSACAFVIWSGNRALYLRLPHRADWLERPWRRITVLLAAIGLFTIPVSWLALAIWQRVTGDPGLRPFAALTAVLAIVIVVVIITHAYETVFLLRDWESARLKAARLEQARLQAKLDALTREVDPHFLFNSLHALAHLVERHDPKTVSYIEALGDAYRYVLSARARRLVTLTEELDALERHRLLTSLRYGDAVRIVSDIAPERANAWTLPPVSLGELVTNAFKHNAISRERPLVLYVTLEENRLVVENEVRPVAAKRPSAGVGLVNLAERHRLVTGLDVSWVLDEGVFRVEIPLSPAPAS
jgi:two-component system, LytTR family, sensor kinase